MLTSPPELFRKAQALKDEGAAFILATVIRVRGSASAKTGSKAIFSQDGINLCGYIGGGCAESHVAQEACEALREKFPRIVEIDLDDVVFGLLPCGGVMVVYLEPHFPCLELALPDLGEWNGPASQFCKELGFQTTLDLQSAAAVKDWRQVFLQIAEALARWKGYPLLPLRDSKGLGAAPMPRLTLDAPQLIVFGQTRITEEFCRLLQIMEWQAQVYLTQPERGHYPAHLSVCEVPMQTADLDIPKGSWVLIASHHRQDAAIAHRALLCGADYVALVSSEKRSRLIAADMLEQGLSPKDLERLFAPAGLNVPTDTPLQIAFSILCEILSCQTV